MSLFIMSLFLTSLFLMSLFLMSLFLMSLFIMSLFTISLFLWKGEVKTALIGKVPKKILEDAGYSIKNGRLHYPEGVSEQH